MVNSYVAMTQLQGCPFDQGSARLRAKSSPLLVFINKVLALFVLHMAFLILHIYFP